MSTTDGYRPDLPNYHVIAPKGKLAFQKMEHAFLFIAVFLAPYALLRFANAIFFTFSDFFFCLSLICLVLFGRIPSAPLMKATMIWLIGFALLFLGLMLSSIFNGDPTRGAIVTLQYFFSYMLLLVVLMRDDFELTHKLAAIFVASVLILDVHGIITFHTVGYVPGEGKGVVTGGKRLATALRNPNLAASMNALTMPFLLYLWSAGRLRTLFALPALAIILYTVVLTSSNSGLINMMMVLTVFVTLVITPKLLVQLTVGVATAVFILVSAGGTRLLPKTFQTRVLQAITSGDINEAGTFLSRADLMKEAISVISDKGIFFLGLGADQFREISVQTAPVHNLYLLLWVEGGVTSLVGWLLFTLAGLLIWLALWRANGPRPALAAQAAVMAVILSIAMFNAHMYARYFLVPILLVHGISLSHLRRLSSASR